MRKAIMILLAMIVIINACAKESFVLCPDNVTRVIDITSCPQEKPECPVCDDNNNCTIDICNEKTGYNCSYEDVVPCKGNGICEEGEFQLSDDCPKSCDDDDSCTEDAYNYAEMKCSHDEIVPCCGNGKCDAGETFVDCEDDCDQLLSIKVTNWWKAERIGNAELNLMRADSIYLVVKFKMNNLAIDNKETLNYKEENGFYYDPFKMRIRDDNGKFYDVEYDSDLIDGWLDYDVIPKGDIKGGALLFIIPKSTNHVRLIAYDKYGSKLDTADVY